MTDKRPLKPRSTERKICVGDTILYKPIKRAQHAISAKIREAPWTAPSGKEFVRIDKLATPVPVSHILHVTDSLSLTANN